MDGYGRGERRRYTRLYEPLPVRVRATDVGGEAFEIQTVLDNFSAGGLYVRLAQQVELGARLLAVVRLAAAPAAPPLRIAVRGIVRRVELQPDNQWGVGVQFTRHRFLGATVEPPDDGL